MDSEKFTNTSITIKGLLGLIEAKDIAIPEIQRPFVWKNSQVRDLIDSLYKGYPTGYIILWKNPNVKLKDGTMSSGKKVIIDGQQRITALMTAVAARKVFNSEFKECRVKIAFDPFAALDYLNGNSEAEIFAVQTPAHLKSKRWIPDIADIFSSQFSSWTFIPNYISENPEMSGDNLQTALNKLKGIETTQLLQQLSALVMRRTGSEYSTIAGQFDSSKGEFRLCNVSAGIGGRSYLAYNKVSRAVEDFCKWLNEEISKVDKKDIAVCYRLSFETHFRLVAIHPWVDGNGRTTRLVMNMSQQQLGLVPSIVRKEDKGEYIQSLVDSRENDDSTIVQDMLLRLHIANLNHRVTEFKENLIKDSLFPTTH